VLHITDRVQRPGRKPLSCARATRIRADRSQGNRFPATVSNVAEETRDLEVPRPFGQESATPGKDESLPASNAGTVLNPEGEPEVATDGGAEGGECKGGFVDPPDFCYQVS
jgi:hypothetical protein